MTDGMTDGPVAGMPEIAAPPDWPEAWFDSAGPVRASAWRGVEAQHVVATMRLVDTLAEQAVLEQILERSKPRLPPGTEGQHYLLAAPFRYRPRHGSRFRRPGALGVWYGAETLRTACAEVAYWRWRFITDSVGLAGTELLTEHSFFCARVDGQGIDLCAAPWSAAQALWTHDSDCAPTQRLAAQAAARGLQCIRYPSVRDAGGVCLAVLQPQALRQLEPGSPQTWHCRTTARGVRLLRDDEGYEWSFAAVV